MTRKLRLGCDMDGVIADFCGHSVKIIKDKWGLQLTKDDFKVPRTAEILYYELFTKEQKAPYKNPRELYRDICPPGFFYDLEPFPGAIDTLKDMCKKYDVTIITKPLDWVHSSDEKVRWLKKYLPDSKYELIMTGSMEVKGLIGVDVMIDDDTRVIKSLDGVVPIVIRQPWNEEYLKFETPYAVDSFSEVPKIIEEVLESIWLH